MSNIVAKVTYDNSFAVVKQNDTVTVPTVGIQGVGATITSLEQLSNVDTVTEGKDNGSILVYRSVTNKWTATTTLDAQNMDGGEF